MVLESQASDLYSIIIRKEDYTIAELLKEFLTFLMRQLHHNPSIQFSGYIQQHPLIHEFILRVKTTSFIGASFAESLDRVTKEMNTIIGYF